MSSRIFLCDNSILSSLFITHRDQLWCLEHKLISLYLHLSTIMDQDCSKGVIADKVAEVKTMGEAEVDERTSKQ